MRTELALCTALLLSACGTSGPDSLSDRPRTQDRDIDLDVEGDLILRTTEELTVRVDTVDVPAERLWREVPAVYDALGIGITAVNTEARILGGENVRVRGDVGGTRVSRLLRCGVRVTGQIADEYDVYLTSLTQVEALERRSVVSTHVRAHALPGGYTSNAVRCASRGELERRILNRLIWEATGVGDEPE